MLKTIFLCMGKFNTYVFRIQDLSLAWGENTDDYKDFLKVSLRRD